MAPPEPRARAEDAPLRTRPVPRCPLCGADGPVVHGGLRDRMYDVPGEWDVRECGSDGCGVAWLDPVPLAEDLPRAYRSYFTHGDGKGPPPSALRRLLRAAREGYIRSRWGGGAGPLGTLLGLLPLLHPEWRAECHHRAMYLGGRPGGRLLEVGCGSGDLLGGMAALGWTATGVDFDPAAVAAARGRGLDVRAGELAGQGFPGGSFDAVVMFHVFEHVPDPRALLAESRRILAPGGRLVIATPNPGSRGRRRFGASWREWDPPRHLHLFPTASLRREVEAAGFRVLSLRTTLRGASGIYADGRAIAATGRFTMGGRHPPGRRLAALLWMFRSALAPALDREEAVVVAEAGGAAVTPA